MSGPRAVRPVPAPHRPRPRACGSVPGVTDSDRPTAPNTTAPTTWALPPVLADPRPVVLACLVGWIVAIVVALIAGGPSSPVLPICYAGLGIGALGVGVFLIQRAAARRGSRGAQQGLL